MARKRRDSQIEQDYKYFQKVYKYETRRVEAMIARGRNVEFRMERMNEREFIFAYRALLEDNGLDFETATITERHEVLRDLVYRQTAYRYYDVVNDVSRYVSVSQAEALHQAAENLGVPEVEAKEFIYGTDDAKKVIELLKEEYHRLKAAGNSPKESARIISNVFFGSQ